MSAIRQIRNTGLASLATLSLLATGVYAAQASPTADTAADENVTLNLLGINDFHGRIAADRQSAGAAVLAGAVDAQREQNPNTLFVSSGDSIGASTFASAAQKDNPTIDALAAGGLDVSAVGNHEFDRGYTDLSGRVVDRYAEKTGEDGAEFALGANVYKKGTQEPALREYAIREVAGLKVGFIGTVTADVPSLVSPEGIKNLDFGSELEAANRVAKQLSDGEPSNGEADVVVLLTHNGSESTDCAAIAKETTDYGSLVRDVDDNVDAIFSGHTHQAYNCDIDGRPVVQSHQYGTTLGQISLEIDPSTFEVAKSTTALLPLAEEDSNGDWAPLFEANSEVRSIVDEAVEESEVVGNEPVGQISEDILRGGDEPGADRGVESTLGNTVADIHLWATSNKDFAGEPAQIAFMNPGGLRADLLYGADGTVTYKAAADVQPFANTLITFDMTGKQIREALEQQWQPEGSERAKLHLGISDGLEYTYVEEAAFGQHVKDINFNGEPLDENATFKVAANAFLATGGDNFAAFAAGTGHADSGQIDLDATVNYFTSHDVVSPAPLGRASLAGTDWATVNIDPAQIIAGESAQVSVTGLEPGAKLGATAFNGALSIEDIPAADAQGSTSFELVVPADAVLGQSSLVLSQVQREDISVDFTVIGDKVSPSPSDEPSTEPSDEPTAEPSQSPSVEPSQSPSASPSVSPSKDSNDSPSTQPKDNDSLADTGFAASWIGIAAGVVIVVGIILLLVRSRKKNSH